MSERQTHLALPVEKHKTELNLFYTRINVFFVFLAVLVSGVTTTIVSGADKLSSSLLWGIVATISLIAWLISWGMVLITRESSSWVNFWHAKIAVFEANNPPLEPVQK